MKVFSGRRIWMALLAMAALLALLAAACGDDGGDDPTAAPAPTATSAAAQQQPATGAQPTAAAQQQPTPAPQPTTPPQQPTAPAAPKIQVVATTNFAADWARIVGGDRVEVFGLLPIGADPHSWQPGAADVAKLADADLVLSIGLGLEAGWLDELIHNASAEDTVLVALADKIDPIEFAETGHDDHEEEEEGGALTGRLLIADRDQATLSVLDLTSEAAGREQPSGGRARGVAVLQPQRPLRLRGFARPGRQRRPRADIRRRRLPGTPRGTHGPGNGACVDAQCGHDGPEAGTRERTQRLDGYLPRRHRTGGSVRGARPGRGTRRLRTRLAGSRTSSTARLWRWAKSSSW